MNFSPGDIEVLAAAATGGVTRPGAGALWRLPDGRNVDHRVRALYMRHLIWINTDAGPGHRVELNARGCEELAALHRTPTLVKGTDMALTSEQAAAVRRALDFLAGRLDATGTPVTHDDAAGGLALLAWHAYQALSASGAPAPERAAELIEQRLLEPRGRIFSGYDDDEGWFPLFTNLEAAKQFAEDAYRRNGPDPDVREFAWQERKERTKAVGYPDSWTMLADGEAAGYTVCGLTLFTDAATAIVADQLEEDAGQRELAALRAGRPDGDGDGDRAESEDACRPVQVPSGEVIRVHGGAPMSGLGAAALGDLVELTRERMRTEDGAERDEEIGPQEQAFVAGYGDGPAAGGDAR